MPYKHPAHLRALLDQYEAARKVTRATTRRRTSERFAKRLPLRTRVELLKLNLKRAQAYRQKMLGASWPATDERSAELVYGAGWRTNTARLAQLTTDLAAATAALAAHDKEHPRA